MNEFMALLLSLSVSGTLLFLIILGLKRLCQNSFSRRWQYYIWLIVVLRLLIPFTWSPINLRSLSAPIHTTAVADEAPAPVAAAAADTGQQLPPQTAKKTEMTPTDTAGRPRPDLFLCLFFAWSVPALVLFVRKITIYQGFTRYIRAGNTEVCDINMLNLLSDCEERLRIRTNIELYCNASVTSPMMTGFFRPDIVLPASVSDGQTLSCIFMHELFHYKRRDMFYKWLVQLTICIHWFNPFVYWLEKEANRACELSCDEAVVAILDDTARRKYGDALILFLKATSLCKSAPASVTLTEDAKEVKERLGAIMNFKKRTKAIRILTGVLTLCIILGAAFIPVYSVTASGGARSESDKASFPAEKPHGADAYIYDEASGVGRYLDNALKNTVSDRSHDYDYDYDYDYDFDWDSDDDRADEERNKGLWDQALLDAYAAYGITCDGKFFYYRGELVYLFLDHRSDSSFYRMSLNQKGIVSIRIIRSAENEITGVAYMTPEEVNALMFGDDLPLINTKEWDCSMLSAVEACYKTDNISILPSPTDKIILKEYLTENQSGYYAGTEIKNGVLTIRCGERPAGSYESCIELYVPDNVLAYVRVETVSGAITADNYTGSLALSTVSGLIDICDSAITGSINSVSGEVTICDSAITGSIDTVSGSVGLFPADMPGNLAVCSHSGKIEVFLPETASCSLRAETDSGRIRSDYFDIPPENQEAFSKIIGSRPKVSIALKTVSGNIEIN